MSTGPAPKSGGGRFGIGMVLGLIIGILMTVIVVGIFFAAGSSVSLPSGGKTGSGETAVDDAAIDKLKLLEQYIDAYYYKSDEVTAQQRQDGMYKGLLESLGDVYSCYYTPEELNDLVQQTEGVYYGIGAYVSKDVETGACVISGVIRNSPAEAAELMEGDIISKVDGEDMLGLELDEVVSRIRGEEGTQVKLTLIRNGEVVEKTITRARVTSPTVEGKMLDDGIGYIQITEFDDVTEGQFDEAFNDLKSQGMKGLIIDLRGNPGGNVTTVNYIARQLLPEGLVFYMEDKNGERTEILTCLWSSL